MNQFVSLISNALMKYIVQIKSHNTTSNIQFNKIRSTVTCAVYHHHLHVVALDYFSMCFLALWNFKIWLPEYKSDS